MTRTTTNESPAPQAEASEHAPWSEDEEDAERLLACASRRKKYGDENCECDEDGSCVECEYDMQDVLKKRYAPLKHTTTPAPQPPVEGLREALERAADGELFKQEELEEVAQIYRDVVTYLEKCGHRITGAVAAGIQYTVHQRAIPLLTMRPKQSLARFAALASPSLTAGPWQPIETAPRDGTPFLCFHPDDVFSAQTGIDLIWYEPAIKTYTMDGDNEVPFAGITHWQPLPPAPATLIEQSDQKRRERG